jgi:hypothetical protein
MSKLSNLLLSVSTLLIVSPSDFATELKDVESAVKTPIESEVVSAPLVVQEPSDLDREIHQICGVHGQTTSMNHFETVSAFIARRSDNLNKLIQAIDTLIESNEMGEMQRAGLTYRKAHMEAEIYILEKGGYEGVEPVLDNLVNHFEALMRLEISSHELLAIRVELFKLQFDLMLGKESLSAQEIQQNFINRACTYRVNLRPDNAQQREWAEEYDRLVKTHGFPEAPAITWGFSEESSES